MLNQFRFKRTDFREFLFRFYKIIIDKNEIIKSLYKFKFITQQSNNIVYN